MQPKGAGLKSIHSETAKFSVVVALQKEEER